VAQGRVPTRCSVEATTALHGRGQGNRRINNLPVLEPRLACSVQAIAASHGRGQGNRRINCLLVSEPRLACRQLATDIATFFDGAFLGHLNDDLTYDHLCVWISSQVTTRIRFYMRRDIVAQHLPARSNRARAGAVSKRNTEVAR
jgi:hypothetical protein